jgi:hypothetical protein
MNMCKQIPLDLLEPVVYRKFLRRTGLNSLIVPIRMNGLTSSGAHGKCYHNVGNLVELIGGKVVLGWAVCAYSDTYKDKNHHEYTKNTIHLMGHAIWLNPEGKMSDPTAKSWLTDADIKNKKSELFGFTWINDNPYIQFIPLVYSDQYLGCNPYDVYLEMIEDGSGKLVDDWKIRLKNEDGYTAKLSWHRIKSSKNDSNFLEKMGCPKTILEKSVFDRMRRQVGYFSERSVATGMTINEIRDCRSIM